MNNSKLRLFLTSSYVPTDMQSERLYGNIMVLFFETVVPIPSVSWTVMYPVPIKVGLRFDAALHHAQYEGRNMTAGNKDIILVQQPPQRPGTPSLSMSKLPLTELLSIKQTEFCFVFSFFSHLATIPEEYETASHWFSTDVETISDIIRSDILHKQQMSAPPQSHSLCFMYRNLITSGPHRAANAVIRAEARWPRCGLTTAT